jgi:RNA polymerase sigma-70 factor (ECF subfamily)
MQLAVRQLAVERSGPHAADLDERAAIAEAFRALPADHRAVLTFAVLDDLPVAEVARLMGKRVGATQSLLHRARGAFRRAYRGDASDD